jgi:hypothetical protein
MSRNASRPDPRLSGLPAGYEFQFIPKDEESREEYITRVFARGEAGRRLLLDPDFNAAYQEILEEQLQQFVTSKPGQSELRDDVYFRIRGIQEIALKFNVWVTLADQLRAQLATQSEGEGE